MSEHSEHFHSSRTSKRFLLYSVAVVAAVCVSLYDIVMECTSLKLVGSKGGGEEGPEARGEEMNEGMNA